MEVHGAHFKARGVEDALCMGPNLGSASAKCTDVPLAPPLWPPRVLCLDRKGEAKIRGSQTSVMEQTHRGG